MTFSIHPDTATLTPWQQRVYQHAVTIFQAGRLGHGLLVCGPAGIGKRAVAQQLVVRVLNHGQDQAARTRNIQLLAAGTHPDVQWVCLQPNKTGDKLRTEIVIEQVRDISHRLSLTPQYGAAQIVIIDPADAINRAAANALLKTLEEPADGRYLWLLSSEPARLPHTIRSRCQRLEMRLPAWNEALAWLKLHHDDETQVLEALTAARGHPQLALHWLRGEGLRLRQQVATELKQLAQGKLGCVELAQRWSADEQTDLRLHHAADWVLECARSSLTNPARLHTLAQWFDAANRTREQLHGPLRADLAITPLLRTWVMAHQAASP